TSNPTQSGITNLDGQLPGNYNLPGGANGSLIASPFSLAGYSAGDQPTLYFNYLLSNDANNSSLSQMSDSARIMISTDGGQTWRKLATNNLILSNIRFPNAELPSYITPSVRNNPSASNSTVQPLFSTSTWMQARIDLSKFAGAASVTLRFDFST